MGLLDSVIKMCRLLKQQVLQPQRDSEFSVTSGSMPFANVHFYGYQSRIGFRFFVESSGNLVKPLILTDAFLFFY